MQSGRRESALRIPRGIRFLVFVCLMRCVGVSQLVSLVVLFPDTCQMQRLFIPLSIVERPLGRLDAVPVPIDGCA